MFELDLPELEQEFRQTWREYDVSRYASFLSRTSAANRLELLTRMLSTELEFFYQRPATEESVDHADDQDDRVSPRVQLFLLRFPDLRARPELILRLIVLEFALRLKYDAVPPNADSYFDLCPVHTQERLIRLLELTENKLHRAGYEQRTEDLPSRTNDSTIKESEASISVTLDPLPYNLGCFLLVRMIGRGGMGYVHAAIDLRSTAQVAVKVMRRIDAWSIFRFIEEV